MGVGAYKSVFLNPWLVAICFLILSQFMNEDKIKSTPISVIIIGAGFSGIGAADVLHRNGITDFLVLEAKDYIGGRVKRVKFSGVNVPLGGGWVHRIEKRHVLRDMLHKHNIKYYVDDYDDLTYRNNLISVIFYFGAMEKYIYEQEASFDFYQFLGDMGGEIGLMLGASLLTFVEFVDLLIYLIYHQLLRIHARTKK